MSDIQPCLKCRELYHIDDMKTCAYDFDKYCSRCDDDLIMIKNKYSDRTYVHKDSLSKLNEESPEFEWVVV